MARRTMTPKIMTEPLANGLRGLVIAVWLVSAGYGLVDGFRLVGSAQARERRFERGRLTRSLRVRNADELRTLGYIYLGTGTMLLGIAALALLK